jgi:hypothetical protein
VASTPLRVLKRVGALRLKGNETLYNTALPLIHLMPPARSAYHLVNERSAVHLPPLAPYIRMGLYAKKSLTNGSSGTIVNT